MSALGFSINTLTLFGLILAIAIVVDDAIVVVENSSRLMDTGKYTAREAVTEAMGEIVGPIVASCWYCWRSLSRRPSSAVSPANYTNNLP